MIEGLFEIFNHNIPFNTEERVTIIHGPNGVGKTTILRLLADLFAKRFYFLRNCPYKKFTLFLEKPSCTLSIERIIPNKPETQIQLRFILRKGKQKQEFTTRPTEVEYSEIRRHIPIHTIEDIIESLEQVGPQKWFDRSSGDYLDIDDVFAIYGDFLPFEYPLAGIDEWLIELLSKLPIHFIQTQRLFAVPALAYDKRRRGKSRSTATVERYSDDMIEKIQDILRQSAVLGASLDRTFPHRLLESEPPSDVTELQIREKYKDQAKYRGRLMDAGLIDPEEPVALPAGEIDKNARRVLWHYLSDVEEKFKIFDGLLKRVELFKAIISTRFLYKDFSVNKEKGFIFTTKKTGAIVPLRTLSSGEQHELVLSYELLFRVKEGSLILIDEPELSLHVTWQHKFLEDITRVSDLADLDFVVATHSPSIIHKKSILMVQLGEHD
jgi:predicted ATPase